MRAEPWLRECQITAIHPWLNALWAQFTPHQAIASDRIKNVGMDMWICALVQYSAKRWRLGCMIPRPDPLWPRGKLTQPSLPLLPEYCTDVERRDCPSLLESRASQTRDSRNLWDAFLDMNLLTFWNYVRELPNWLRGQVSSRVRVMSPNPKRRPRRGGPPKTWTQISARKEKTEKERAKELRGEVSRRWNTGGGDLSQIFCKELEFPRTKIPCSSTRYDILI